VQPGKFTPNGSKAMKLTWIPAARRAAALAAAMGAAATLLACTTMGTGTGALSPGNRPVTFDWTSKDGGITGTMSATVAGNGPFLGPFLQVTSSVRSDSVAPMWDGWGPDWGDWGAWGWDGPVGDTVSTNYSGKVVANLTGPNGQQLRCRFQLNDPIAGMGGGGLGDCQFTGGRTVSAVFARS
jgi:hypothetical protein